MNTLEIALTILIALVLLALASYFAWHQRATLQALRFDTKLTSQHRRYLAQQAGRRFFGSVLLVLLAGMLIGSLFLTYDPMLIRGENEAIPENVKMAFRVTVFYWMTTLLVLLVVVCLAVIDLWATARFAIYQQKQLALDHQAALEAELAQYRMEQREQRSDS